MSRNIIRDGYTRDGYISARSGLHDELSFTYRPMLPEQVEQVEEFRSAVKGPQKAKEAALKVADVVARQLASWSEVDESENQAQISVENVRRLPYQVLTRAYAIISGLGASDVREGSTAAEADDFMKDWDAQRCGNSPGVQRLEEAEKN